MEKIELHIGMRVNVTHELVKCLHNGVESYFVVKLASQDGDFTVTGGKRVNQSSEHFPRFMDVVCIRRNFNSPEHFTMREFIKEKEVIKDA